MDATEGRVLLNGHDVRDLDARVLWDRVGLVPQRPYLFSGTVASNLRFGDPAADEQELWHALTVAQGRDFVASMPLSSSPRSRRAAPTSPAGSASACASPAPWSRSPRCTCSTTPSAPWTSPPTPAARGAGPEIEDALMLVVAQRVSTITRGSDPGAGQRPDRRQGTHAELLESSETYQEIVRSQGVEEEVS